MRGLKIVLLIISLAVTIPVCNVAQSQMDSAYGKPVVLIFSNIHSNFSKEGHAEAFELTRAYLGYEYNFNRNFSGAAVLDVADPGTGGLQMTAIIKNAYLKYNNRKFSIRTGVIGTDQYNVQERHWGYRYIFKSFQDEHGFGPSADLGAELEYSPSKVISLDFSVLNGEGYKRIQSDSSLKVTGGITLKPLGGFLLRGYYDHMGTSSSQRTVALFAGYTYNKIKVGLEYNIQKNNKMIKNHDFSGISAYASWKFGSKFSVFSRYDYLWFINPDGEPAPWSLKKDIQLFMSGFDYSPVKGVKLAPVFLTRFTPGKSNSLTSTVSLNIEIRM